MCLIIDNNVVHRVLRGIDDADFANLKAQIFATSGPFVRIAYGGRLREEYTRSSDLVRVLTTLDRAGRTIKIRDDLVDQEEEIVNSTGECVSDDPHVIALARLSKVRLLCSHDQALHTDFRNPRLVNPRGHIYQSSAHDHLLRQFCESRRVTTRR